MEVLSNSSLAVKVAHEKGYRVNEIGQPINPNGVAIEGRISSSGYRVISIKVGRKTFRAPVHRLVAYQKYGESIFDTAIHVRHLNGRPLDNSHSNIAIGSASDNCMDRTPEARQRAAMIATTKNRKYDPKAVKRYYDLFGFTNAMKHFNISSKGTMSFLINHSEATAVTNTTTQLPLL